MLRALSALPVLLAVVQDAPAQSSWDRYVRRPLKAIITEHDSSFRATARTMGAPGRHVSADQFPSRVKLQFEASFRPISPKRLEFIRGYFANVVQRQLPADFLEQEVLVTEDTVQYWLPIQTSLIAPLKKEAASSREVCFFLIWLGALDDRATLDWIFVVNEFDTKVEECQ